MRKTKKPKRNARDMVSVGIDLGDTTSHATIFANEKADTFEFPMDGLGHALLKERVPSDAWIVFESSGATYPFYRQLRELGFADITVAHPKELSWIVRSKKKSDKVDSQKLAKLRSVGMIPEAHLLEREDQIFRDLLIQRVKIGAEVSQIKNGIIGYLKREGLFQDLPDSVANFSEERSEPIRAISFRDDRDLVLSTMTNRLEFTEKLAPSLEKRIKAQAKENEDVRLLMSIPGVSFYPGSLVSSYIEDVPRFPDADHLTSFFGIVPAERNSSSMRRVGHMTKDGPRTARKALSIMVDSVALHDTHLREYYQRERARTGSGKMAHVLTMRKLVRMIYTILTRKEKWRWGKEALTKRKLEAHGHKRTPRPGFTSPEGDGWIGPLSRPLDVGNTGPTERTPGSRATPVRLIGGARI